MNFFYHKDLGNHLLQLCPKVVKHPVCGSTTQNRSQLHFNNIPLVWLPQLIEKNGSTDTWVKENDRKTRRSVTLYAHCLFSALCRTSQVMLLPSVFRRVTKLRKATTGFTSVCMYICTYVRPHGTTRLPPYGFS